MTPTPPASPLTLKRGEAVEFFSDRSACPIAPGFQPGQRALITELIGGETLYIERNPVTGRRTGPVLFGATGKRVHVVDTTDATLAEALKAAAVMWPEGYQILAPDAFKDRCAEIAAREGVTGQSAPPRKAAPVYAEERDEDGEGLGRMR